MARTPHRPLVLGLSGGTAPLRTPDLTDERRMSVWFDTNHDSAAALVRDGTVLAAVEEERLNRLEHTNKLAGLGIRACLGEAGLSLDEVDCIAYYCREDLYEYSIVRHMMNRPGVRMSWSGRGYLAEVLSQDLGETIDPSRIMFIEHHLTHATSAYALSGFPDALVVALDGQGDGVSGTVWAGRGGTLTRLHDIPIPNSLGAFYLEPTRYLAYRLFDEYKVMGLAAYGDPSRYRDLFESTYTLDPDGGYTLHNQKKMYALEGVPPPRRSGNPMTRDWQDLAAAGQEALERIAMHLFTHFRRDTGLRHLCVAGGVMHNSSMIGKVARSGLFDGVFVQPAASDAGCALGAALVAHRALAPDIPIQPMTHAYWGPGLGDHQTVRRELEPWRHLVDLRRSDDIAAEAAALLAEDAVIGWVQGRSEFGPRALGNRSILADPRPAANKDRINHLVKQRESYRPFAPAVISEAADRFFEMPPGTCADYMTLTVPVRPEARPLLGAVTHVDGTARVQTVSRGTNPRFWALLRAFEARTGVPVLLNTSFNHSVEPIVQSIEDAITCFLTTGLTHLIVDDYVVMKRESVSVGERVWALVPTIPDHIRIVHARQRDAQGELEDVFRCEHVVTRTRTRNLGVATCALLQHADGRRSLAELFEDLNLSSDRAAIAAEIETLWGERLIELRPAGARRAGRVSDRLQSEIHT